VIVDVKPYPAYKDSGVPWLGNVPEHWQVVPLCAIACEKSITGQQHRSLLSVYLNKGVVKFSDVEEKRTNVTSEDLSKYQAVDPGDFVLNNQQAWRGSVGVSALSGIVSPAYLVLSLAPRIDRVFADLLFRQRAMVDQYLVCSKGVGSIQRNLYWPYLKRVTTLLPSLDEQTAIARFLDHADRRIKRYIRAKQKLIKLLEEQKQAIIHRAVTRGLNPNLRLKPSGVEWLGDVPEHWEVCPLSRLLIQRKEKNHPVKTTNILSLSLKAGVIPYAEKEAGGNKAKEDLSAYMLAYPGDIVVNSMNVVVGSVGLSKYFGAVSPVYYMLRPRGPCDAVKYFSAVFRDIGFQRSLFGLGNGIMYIESKSSGKLNTIRLRIPMTRLKRVFLPRPPSGEQAAIVEHLDEITADVAAALSRTSREIDLLHEYRTRLIADVVTGKLDVREAASKLPDETNEADTFDDADMPVEDEDNAEGADSDAAADEVEA
jgi:type I restriction enzyme S subunit